MDNKKRTKFYIGEEVLITNINKKGIIKDIVSYLGEGNNVYLVDVDNKEKVYAETILDYGYDLLEIKDKFQNEIENVIKDLNLKSRQEKAQDLLNACRLQAYLVRDDAQVIKDYARKIIKRDNLFDEVNDSVINSYLFSEILSKIDMNVLNVLMRNEDSDDSYVSNLVLINKSYYYFDVTLEEVVFKENGVKEEEFVLSCGALGSTSYEQFFTPLNVIDYHKKLEDNSLPNNIAQEDIDIDVVNKLLLMSNS